MAVDSDLPPATSDGPASSYEASVSSSASTTQASIFDDVSEQSSVASSMSDDFRHDDREHKAQSEQLTYANITSIPAAQRQHPRRSSLARNQKPPALVRQADRKLNFVDNLVDSATQMVEVIWSLSMINCRVESHGRGVLPLRTYIEETLRRSRTSYSTLQVALYYLVLIQPYVPRAEPSAEQGSDYQANRVLVCGRRMFLAALILASKYLQDRNYSAKAWSKMSGLKIAEINSNERIFLEKIQWKLHVEKSIFDRWTEIVLKYTPSAQLACSEETGVTWKSLVPILTPELNTVPATERAEIGATPSGMLLTPCTPTPSIENCGRMSIDTVSQETTPTPASIAPPRFMEPRTSLVPPTPGLVRMGPLPTPQMTPSSVAASTPAASACSSRRPSICNAMSIAARSGINRCVTDEFPFPSMDKLRMQSRRTSVTSMTSARSSPESMMTDMSRSSRASSISSVTTMSTTSTGPAPRRTNLARMATTRNVKHSLSLTENNMHDLSGSATRPITIAEDDEREASPPDFAVNERKLHTPHRHSKHAPHGQVVQSTSSHHGGEKSRKRNRHARGSRRSDLYDEVRYQLEEEQEDAMVIDLVDSDEDMTSPLPQTHQPGYMPQSTLQAKAYQPPATLSGSMSGRIPLSRYDGSKRTCYSADNTINAANQASLYMEIA